MATFAKSRVPAEDLWYGTHRPCMKTNVLLQHVNPGQVRIIRLVQIHTWFLQQRLQMCWFDRSNAQHFSILQRTRFLVHPDRLTRKAPGKVPVKLKLEQSTYSPRPNVAFVVLLTSHNCNMRAVTGIWKQHHPNPFSQPGPDFRAMNKQATIQYASRQLALAAAC